jgi:hypothetical protein
MWYRLQDLHTNQGSAAMQTDAKWMRPVAVIAAIFGALTIYSGGMALFAGPESRAAVGNAVPFVLWFNFAMGFAYLAAATLIYQRHPLAKPLAWIVGLATAAVFAAFLVTILSGTAYEMRTMGAMVLRSGFWLGIAAALTWGGL